MPWKIIDPSEVKPEMFDLAQVTTCKVKEFRGSEDAIIIRMEGWHLFINLLNRCPVTGFPLKEPTWYLYAAQGISEP